TPGAPGRGRPVAPVYGPRRQVDRVRVAPEGQTGVGGLGELVPVTLGRDYPLPKGVAGLSHLPRLDQGPDPSPHRLQGIRVRVGRPGVRPACAPVPPP